MQLVYKVTSEPQVLQDHKVQWVYQAGKVPQVHKVLQVQDPQVPLVFKDPLALPVLKVTQVGPLELLVQQVLLALLVLLELQDP